MSQADSPPSEPTNGSFGMELHFRLDALPQKLSSSDEVHVLFTYAELETDTDLCWIGVTPSGRIVGGAMNGLNAQSGPGFMVPNKKWHVVKLTASNDLIGNQL